jgi:hypothetical protein
MQPEHEDKAVPLAWVGPDEVPVVLANQFISQFHHDGFVLTVGQVTPPIILGSDEQQRDQLEALTFVPVRPLARFALTEQRVRELIKLLTDNLAMYEASRERSPE